MTYLKGLSPNGLAKGLSLPLLASPLGIGFIGGLKSISETEESSFTLKIPGFIYGFFFTILLCPA